MPLYPLWLGLMLPAARMQGIPADPPACPIVKVSYSTGDEYLLRYDAAGRLLEVAQPQGNFISLFSYQGDTVVSESSVNGLPDGKVTYVVNPYGLVTWAKEEKADGGSWHIRSYEYNGTQLRKVTHTDYPGAANTYYEVYTWHNGNPVKIEFYDAHQKPDGATSLQYYTDKPWRPGDYWNEATLLTGMESIRPKNLVKSVGGAESTHISYVFDVRGKITGMKETEERDMRTCSYKYRCDEP